MSDDEYQNIIDQIKRDITPHVEALLVANENLTRRAYHDTMDDINDIILGVMTARMPNPRAPDRMNQTRAASWLGIARGTLQLLIKKRCDNDE